MRCRERSCQLGYNRRGVVCHAMQDLSLGCVCGCARASPGRATDENTRTFGGGSVGCWMYDNMIKVKTYNLVLQLRLSPANPSAS